MHNKVKAYTLLEVLLALALSSLVFVALGMAVSLHLRLLDSGRTKVEEAQLARAILQNIARDLRSAVPFKTDTGDSGSFDLSEDSASGSQGGGGQSGGGQSGGGQSGGGNNQGGGSGGNNQGGQGGGNNQGGQGGGGNNQGGQGGNQGQSGNNNQSGQGSGSSGGSGGNNQGGQGGGNNIQNGQVGQQPNTDVAATDTATTEDRTTNLAEATPQSQPGLYGNLYELQIDVSRMPRVDQFIAAANQPEGMTNADQTSDMKNVSYFVYGGTSGVARQTIGGTTSMQGLFRREMGRETGVFAAQQGQLPASTKQDLLAPEVQAVEFRYYDGTQWLEEWDSVSAGDLPAAVEISIAVTPQQIRTTTTIQPNIYRLLVQIPSSKITASSALSTSTSTTQSTSTSQP